LDREQLLLQRARQLDEQALAEIFDEYYRPLYRYIYPQVGGAQAAEDLTAEVFSRLLESLHAGRGPRQHLKAWLFRVAYNLVVDEARSRRRSADLELSEEIAAGGKAVEEQVQQVILTTEAREALQSLTPKQRSVIVLKFLVGMDNAEVAHVLSLPVTAVKSLQHRGLAALRRNLGQAGTWTAEGELA
jgi:RNA polymerase sigma-70 factor (ECF subfamily)